ncbi:MAG: BlaI/MecI/CopY family transcriptional regulator [Armatimonadetes bacterium]|nr:BlaI/MecI/CopY family transcriptional regulator [Armatimonadota bacterium]MBS1729031.1 BlaI/MecI/CopY family transcriptional regulator [Armatimonadota bacterium]
MTGAQYDIVRIAWESERPISVTELWQELGKNRDVARTTVLTWVQRLEKRGWLRRVETLDGLAYSAAAAPEDGAVSAAERVMNTLFNGSASGLMMALAGRGHVDAEEIARLRQLLADLEEKNESQP